MNLYKKGVDGVQKFTNFATSTSELASTHKQFIIKQIINTALLLIILVVFGCFDFVHLKLHLEYIINPDFWYMIFSKIIVVTCSYNVGINVVIDELIKRNTVLAEAKITYEKLNVAKDSDFEEYIETVYNPTEKKKFYINYINRRIYLLNKFSRRKDRVLYTSTLPDKQKLKETNKYCIRRKQLEYLKSEEYINANLDSLVVKYRDISASLFELEINGTQRIKQNQITGSIGKGRVIGSITTAALVLGITMFFNSWSADPNGQEFADGVQAAVSYVIKMFTDIGIVLWQFIRGIVAASRIVSSQLTHPFVQRVEILKKYYQWRIDNGKDAPQCYYDIFKQELVVTNYPPVKDDSEPSKASSKEEKEIVMTEEEYNKYLNNKKEVE